MKFVGDFGPEFAEDVVGGCLKNAEDDGLPGGENAPLVVWMIGIAENDRTGGSQPDGKIEHAGAVIAMGDDGVFHGMEESFPEAAMGETVVARVL